MKLWKNILLTTLLLALAIMLAGCSKKEEKPADESSVDASVVDEQVADEPTTGALTQPDYQNEINGRFVRFDDGTVMLISDQKEAIILGGDMNFDGLDTGDQLKIYCDDIEETYPARTVVKEMWRGEKGTVNDLPQDVLEQLAGFGYKISINEDTDESDDLAESDNLAEPDTLAEPDALAQEETHEESHHSDDDCDDFGHAYYPDDILVQLASDYYYKHHGEYAPKVEVDSHDGEIVTIHLYEIAGDHTATWDWYYIDRNNCQGEDFLGNSIDISE